MGTLTKQGIPVSFAMGLDTKTDPKQIQLGKFLQLENSVFTNGGELQKRNGYASLATLPNSSYTYLTTFNGNLTAVGESIAAYDNPNASWVSKGLIQPLSLSTLPVIRNNLNQSAFDVAVAPSGLACVVYLEVNGSTVINKYAVFDSVTGQNIVAPTVMPAVTGTVSGGMRAFYLGTNFIMVSTYTSGGSSFLQYVAIDATDPVSIGSPTTLSSNSYVPSQRLSWDAVIANDNLYFAYDSTSGGQGVYIQYLTSGLVVTGSTKIPTLVASIMSLCADETDPANPIIYLNFYDAGSHLSYMAAVDKNLSLVMAPDVILTSTTLLNVTAAAQNSDCTVFYEVENSYSYDSSIPTSFILTYTVKLNPVTFSGVFTSGSSTITASSISGLAIGDHIGDLTTPSNLSLGTTISSIVGSTLHIAPNTTGNSASSPGDTLNSTRISSQLTSIRSLGLASKAFINDGIIYFLGAYQSDYQPTYFLVNVTSSTDAQPILAAKLAYENGGGYLANGLPNTPQIGESVYLGYLFKDLIQAVNKGTNLASGTQTAGIYSQTGINLARITFGTDLLDTAEIGSDLHISGGFLWMYDGYLPLEHNFFLWPDDVKAATQVDPVINGSVTVGSNIAVMNASLANVSVGMGIGGIGSIPDGTTVLAISGSNITMSDIATNSAPNVNITFTGSQSSQQYFYQVTYEWSDNQGNIFRSAPSIPVTATTSSGNSSVVLNIPTLRVTMKTANPVKIVIYRWSVAQQNYYQVTSITSPLLNSTVADSVVYVDGLADDTILGNNLIYTTGGVVEDVNAPASNLMTLFDTRLWLVDAEDPNLVWYSKQVIENTPVEMSDLLTVYIPQVVGTTINTGPITAIATMDDKVLFAKTNSWVYINGTGPDNTGANSAYSQPIFITSTVGCTNQKSIVLSPNGLMFQSDKGIWLIDRGLGTSFIGAPVQAFTQGQMVNSAVLVPGTTQVRFTLNSGITLMYDYYYDQWGTFSVEAISSVIYQNLHTFIDGAGNVYQESIGSYVDGATPVNMSFQTGPIRLGDLQNYQRFYFFYLLGTYYSPHFLTFNLTYDYGPSSSQTIAIQPGAVPGIAAGDLEDWRIFPTNQRCSAVSIMMQESYDASLGGSPGAGLTLSGLNVVCGFKKAFRPQPAAKSAG